MSSATTTGDAVNNNSAMNGLYAARRRRNGIMMTLSVGATLLGLGWLVVILGELFWQGFSGLSLAVFTEMTPPPGSDGGLLNPIIGSLILTVLAVVIGTPIGMLAGTYMAEYGRHDKLSSVVRFINDILLERAVDRGGPVHLRGHGRPDGPFLRAWRARSRWRSSSSRWWCAPPRTC